MREFGEQDLPFSAPERKDRKEGKKPIMSVIADLLQQKVGLSPDQAQQAEQVVIQHITSKVPSEFQGMLGPILGTGAGGDAAQPADSGGMGGLLGEATKLFGG